MLTFIVTVWIKIRPDVLLSLIRTKLFAKAISRQQNLSLSLAVKELNTLNCSGQKIFECHRVCCPCGKVFYDFHSKLFISVIYEMYVRVDRVSKMCELDIYMANTASVWNKNDDA